MVLVEPAPLSLPWANPPHSLPRLLTHICPVELYSKLSMDSLVPFSLYIWFVWHWNRCYAKRYWAAKFRKVPWVWCWGLFIDLSGYLCALVFWNIVLLRTVLCCCSAVAFMWFVGGAGSCTLESNAGNCMCVGEVVGWTLGDVAALVNEGCFESDWIRFSCVASVNSALRTGSPAWKLKVVIDGGRVKIDLF